MAATTTPRQFAPRSSFQGGGNRSSLRRALAKSSGSPKFSTAGAVAGAGVAPSTITDAATSRHPICHPIMYHRIDQIILARLACRVASPLPDAAEPSRLHQRLSCRLDIGRDLKCCGSGYRKRDPFCDEACASFGSRNRIPRENVGSGKNAQLKTFTPLLYDWPVLRYEAWTKRFQLTNGVESMAGFDCHGGLIDAATPPR